MFKNGLILKRDRKGLNPFILYEKIVHHKVLKSGNAFILDLKESDYKLYEFLKASERFSNANFQKSI